MHGTGSALLYRGIKGLVRFFYPKIMVEGAENLPDESCIIVGNHAQIHGPIASELYFPAKRYTWCAGEMMHLKEVPDYAFSDFWSGKPKWNRWFFRLLSYIIAPLSVCIFNNADTIGVYHDARLMTTFRTTLQRLQEGASVVIFPERDAPYNHILCDFQEKFVDIAKLYYKKTGKVLAFTPIYLAPNLKKMVLGAPVYFRPDAPIQQERKRICLELKDAITQMALALPPHTVVPYQNISKKHYPRSRPEVSHHEKTCC